MRRFFLLSAALVVAIAVLAGCNSQDKRGGAGNSSGKAGTVASSTSNVPSDGVRRITTVELRDALAQGTAIVVDTRPVEAYKQSHIKGSISIPLDQVDNRINELPRDKMIVTYCS